jgi:adenylate cyclase, class 2
VSIEAELKARLRDPERVRALLAAMSNEEINTYQDAYFDTHDGSFTAGGQELRVRLISGTGGRQAFLTYKAASVHEASGSKPEYETAVGDPDSAKHILAGLGFVETIAFSKQCRNYRLRAHGRELLATLVHVPEVDSHHLELETIVDRRAEVDEALSVIREVLAELAITDDDLTAELYTDAVRQHRQKR